MKSNIASSKIERRKQGKALREKCPRTLQAEWKPRSKSQDIIRLLEESDADMDGHALVGRPAAQKLKRVAGPFP